MTKSSDQSDSRRRPPAMPPAAAANARASAAAVVPPPPREMTHTVRRRSWGEPKVRFWALGTLFLLGIVGWFLVQQAIEYSSESKLIASGKTVLSTLTEANGETRVGAKFPPGATVTLKFDINGQTENVTGELSSSDYITVGEEVTIHVNPDDPTQWTDRNTAESLGYRLLAAGLVIPVAVATALAALLTRRRVLRTWREAPAVAYNVSDVRTTALAPLAYTVRCAVAHGRSTRLVTVFLPSRLPRPKPGEVIWLLHPPGKEMSSIPVAAYV